MKTIVMSVLGLAMLAGVPQAAHAQVFGRLKDKVEIQNLARQIAQAYKIHHVANDKGPDRIEDLGPDISRNGKILAAIKGEEIKVVWGLRNMDGQTAVVFEPKATMGRRIVAFGDASVREIDDAEFKKLGVK